MAANVPISSSVIPNSTACRHLAMMSLLVRSNTNEESTNESPVPWLPVSWNRSSSISVEDDFWSSLREIAKARHQTVSHLVSSIYAERQHANLSSAVRLFVLGFYRNQLA